MLRRSVRVVGCWRGFGGRVAEVSWRRKRRVGLEVRNEWVCGRKLKEVVILGSKR